MEITQVTNEYFMTEYHVKDGLHTVAITYTFKDANIVKNALESARAQEQKDEDAWLAS